MNTNKKNSRSGGGTGRRSRSRSNNNGSSSTGTGTTTTATTAMERKEIERNRRLHMKSLCSKLASLIPKEHYSTNSKVYIVLRYGIVSLPDDF